MRFTRLAAIAAALFFCSPVFAQQHPNHCPRGTTTQCTTTAPANTTQIDPPWLIAANANVDFAQWFNLNGIVVGTNGAAPRIAIYSDILGLFTGTLDSSHCPSGAGTMVACGGGGGSMTWPAAAGIPNYNGLSAWGTSYSATNPIPANFVSTLNQNTTGTAGGLSATLVAASGGTGSATAPTSGQIPVGNVGGTAYAPQTVSGDCTLSSAGAVTCTKTSGTAFSALATTVPGTGVAAFLATPSSANFAAAVTGETGTGAVVFGTSPSLTTPNIGAATGTSLSVTGQLTSTVATGTAPLAVTSTTQVANLQAATAGALAAAPTTCTSTQAATGILANGNATGCFTPSGSGTVTDGAGTSTANALLASTTTAHAYSVVTTLPTAAMPALTGDVTNSAGSLATTVGKINGGTVPASASVLGSNGSSQPVSATAANVLSLINGQTCNAQTGTTYTFVLGDANNCVTMSNAAANTITVPANSSVAYPVGTTLTVVQINTGATTLQGAGTPVTLQSAKYGSSTTQTYAFAAEYDCLSIQKTATDTWFVASCSYNPGGGTGTVTTTGTPASTYLAAFSGSTSITGTANATLSAGALTLGASGTAGSVTMGNATSGLVTLQPVTGALGTVTASFPANTGTVAELNLGQTFTATQVFPYAQLNGTAVASSSFLSFQTAPFTGGTGSTTRPELYFNTGVTAPTTFSTAGTFLGGNAPSAFTGNLEAWYINGGAAVYTVNYQGNVTGGTYNGSTIPTSAGTLPGSSGAFTLNDCLEVGSTSPLQIIDTGATCGTGGGGSAFNAITTGTNTTATMTVGTGATLTFSGTGTVNASTLGGATFAAPGSIGSSAAASGAFTTLSASSTVSGTGFSTYLASPPAIGGTTAAAGTFTTLTATNVISAASSVTSATSITPDCTKAFQKIVASATGTFTVNAPGTCTPTDGQKLELKITSPAGGTITYSWNATYLASATLALPTTSNAASKEDYFQFQYDSDKSGWVFLADNQGF